MLEILNDLKPFLPSKKEQAKIIETLRKESQIKTIKKEYECIFLALDNRIKYRPCEYLYENKSQKYLNERDFIKKHYENIKINIFCTDKTHKKYKNSKSQTIIKINQKTSIIPQISTHLKASKKYILPLINLDNKQIVELVKLSKIYNIKFIEFKKHNKKILVRNVSNLYKENFTNLAFIMHEFSRNIKMPFVSTDEPLYLHLKEFGDYLLAGNFELFLPLYKKIIKKVNGLDKNSIFYPFKLQITNILQGFRINEMVFDNYKHKALVLFENHLMLAKVFYDRGYYLNSLIMLKEGFDVGVYQYFMGDFGLKIAKSTKFSVFWNGIFKNSELDDFAKKYLKSIYKIRCKIAKIRNAFVHLEGLENQKNLIRDLNEILCNINQILNQYSMIKIEPYKEQIANKIKEKLQLN